MKVVITGGGGFLGTMLCQALLQRGQLTSPTSGQPQAIRRIVLLDSRFGETVAGETVAGDGPAGEAGNHQTAAGGPVVQRWECEISDRDAVQDAVGSANDLAVFHLASMVSGECELRFDDCLRVNLDGGRHLLEAVRQAGQVRQPRQGGGSDRSAVGKPRLVFASSIACFGGDTVADSYDDRSKLLPGTSYGMTKVIGELLINDYSRKGFLDGRSARLPTVIIRPGKPNAAASSWASGMFREPLGGVDCQLPVHGDQRHPTTDHRTVIESLIALHEISGQRLGCDRAVGLPAVTITPNQAYSAVCAVAERRGLTIGRLVDDFDPRIQAIVDGWPTAIDGGRGVRLGLPSPPALERIVENYLDDFGD